MTPLDRFEKGIENILGEFNLKLSKPEIATFPNQKMLGYYRDCDLRSIYPTRLIVERSWCGGLSENSVLDFCVEQVKEDKSLNFCHVNLPYTGAIILDLNFYDFEKLRNYTPDPSLVQLMKQNKRTLEGDDFYTGKTRTFECMGDGSYKEVSPLFLNTVRNMMLNDVLYEGIYRHDKKKFDEKVSDSKIRGDSFLEDLAVYFCKFRKEFGFSF